MEKPTPSRANFSSLVRHPVIWPLILLIEVLIYSCFGIFVNLSRTDGSITYQSSSMVLCIEMLKFTMAFVIAWPAITTEEITLLRLSHVLPLAVPALCYCLTNNLAVSMQDHMDPATFQVLCNLKIVSTALLYRIIMKSYSGLSSKKFTLTEVYITAEGLMMTLLYCFISGFSGVFTEYILKRDNKIPLSFQNCFLYSFGILLNLSIWCVQGDKSVGFLHGFTPFTWAAVICQAVNGLMMSVIMKYSSNLVRLFVITSAIPVATVLSMMVFHLQPGPEFFLIILIVMTAIYFYNYL